MLDKDIKEKAMFLQKLRNNKIFNERQLLNISYEQGKKLKLTKAEDKLLIEACTYISNNKKIDLEYFTKGGDDPNGK